jgi:hypothetical protein
MAAFFISSHIVALPEICFPHKLPLGWDCREGVEAYIGELEKENEQGPGPIAGMRVKQSQLYRFRSVGSPRERSRRSLEDSRAVIPGSSAASVIPLQ